MSNSQVTTIDDLREDSNEKQFNILNPRDYQHVMEELSKNKNLFDLMRKGFQLKYDVTRGIQLNELQELIQTEHEKETQFMLKEVENLSEGQSTCLATTSVDTMKRDSILIFGKFVGGKYDILNVRATQIKTIDEQKLITCGIGAACAGFLVGSIATPVVGAITAGSILVAGGAKAIYDYQKAIPDLIYSYIFKELTDKNVISIDNDHYTI
ncbi:hypothetical protein I4U23_010658 [Adineta vaga]|nr:hypothetical protein I4U23_010658 [Adineta vaga]